MWHCWLTGKDREATHSPSKADETAIVRWWESRSLPGFYKGPLVSSQRAFVFVSEIAGVPGLAAPAPPGATLPASAGRKPSGIPSAAICRSQCLS